MGQGRAGSARSPARGFEPRTFEPRITHRPSRRAKQCSRAMHSTRPQTPKAPNPSEHTFVASSYTQSGPAAPVCAQAPCPPDPPLSPPSRQAPPRTTPPPLGSLPLHLREEITSHVTYRTPFLVNLEAVRECGALHDLQGGRDAKDLTGVFGAQPCPRASRVALKSRGEQRCPACRPRGATEATASPERGVAAPPHPPPTRQWRQRARRPQALAAL